MKKHYSVFKATYDIDGIGKTESYGIRAADGNKVISEIPDISTELDLVTEIAELLNRKNISPEHALDVVLDLIP